MDQPKGFWVKGEENKVCHLVKAIYGLKQAGCQWHKHLHDSLLSFSFHKLLFGDVFIFFNCHNGGDQIMIILIYVNDIAIFGTLTHIQEVKNQIGTWYKYINLSEINQFLGLRILCNRLKCCISVNQHHYIKMILTHFDISSNCSASTPFAAGTKLIKNPSQVINTSRRVLFQSMVGSLMYAMLSTCPDICYAVNRLSQFGSNPSEEHIKAAQHVFQYLKATTSLSLGYGSLNNTKLISYSDSDWASDRDDRCSTCGYVFLLTGGSIA